MSKKYVYTGQNANDEFKTFSAAGMEQGLETHEDSDYLYFFKVTGLENKPKKKVKVLEVGCGSGPLGRRLAKYGYQVTGIDLSGILVRKANVLAKQEKIKYKAVTADIFKYNGKGYDIVVCSGFLHHFTELGQIVEKVGGFLKKNGYMAFIETNGSNPAVRYTEFFRKHIWPFNKMSNLGTPNETSHSARRYIAEFEKAGYKMDLIHGFIASPKFGDYGLFMNILLRIKYFFHDAAAMLMPGPERGTMLIMKFRKI